MFLIQKFISTNNHGPNIKYLPTPKTLLSCVPDFTNKTKALGSFPGILNFKIFYGENETSAPFYNPPSLTPPLKFGVS